MNHPRVVVFIILIVFPGFSLWTMDTGLLLDQNADFNTQGVSEWVDKKFEYSGVLIPRVSTLLGDDGEFIFSAGLNYAIEPLSFMPEFLRTELTMRFGMGEIRLGRMPYRDPLRIIAEGFFDGALYSYDTRAGTLSVGGWYTGLLYKKRAAITMTDDEEQLYYKELNYDDFANTYFAPRRVLASLGWEHSSLWELLNVRVALLGQFDLSGADLNSQYLAAKITLPFRYIVFDAGGCFELMEYDEEFGTALAAEIGLTWMLPTRLENHILLRGRFSSGMVEDSPVNAFQPVTTIPQGNLLKAKLSGLSVLSLGYLARLHRVLSTDLTASYFVRSDLGTYTYYPVINTNSDGYFLGSELFLRFLWSISTGIQMNLGGGMFLPSLGDAAPKADMLWRAELNMILSFF